jgi:ATP-binding cassette subfamily B protein
MAGEPEASASPFPEYPFRRASKPRFRSLQREIEAESGFEMSTVTANSLVTTTGDVELIERYTDQPARLPSAAREQIAIASGEPALVAYALVDLDAELRLCEHWLALTPGHVVFWSPGTPARVHPRRAVLRCPVDRGLSCNTLRIELEGGHPPLVVRYTQRQRSAVERIIASLEGELLSEQTDADAAYAAEVARPIRQAQALVSKSSLFILVRLLRYLLPYRRHLVLGLSAAGVITLCALVPPYLTGYLIDGVLRPVQAGQLAAADVAWIGWYCVAAMAAVYLLRRAAAWVRLRLMAVLGEYVARDLRGELYDHLQKLSIAFYSRKKTGSLITRVSADTDRLWDFLAFGVVDLSLGVVMLLGLCAVLISLDPVLGVLMALPLPFIYLAIRRNSRRMDRLFQRAFRRWSNVTDVLSDTIPGIRVVRAFNQHRREAARFRAANEAATADFNLIHGVWTSFWPGVMLTVELAIILVWTVALPRLLGSDSLGKPLSVGVFVSFLLYTGMFMWPIEIIGQMTRIVNRATTSAHRVFEVLDTRPDVVDAADALQLEQLTGRLRFEDVSFSYDEVRPTLKHVSFEVEPGEMIGLVGPSGGGKSTLVNLITRFYDVSSGRILVDGIELRRLDSGAYRRHVGMVLQDPYLFHGSVLDNIRYGVPGATPADVVEAARVANAHDFVCKLPHGYDTLVGERGHTLSGGERQRVSIARAVLQNPRILILDEATSAVDTETERKIQEAMDRLSEGRTVFAIAHRLSTLRRASRLFVVEDGRVTESGTHAHLMENETGTYRRLYQLQQQLHEG